MPPKARPQTQRTAARQQANRSMKKLTIKMKKKITFLLLLVISINSMAQIVRQYGVDGPTKSFEDARKSMHRERERLKKEELENCKKSLLKFDTLNVSKELCDCAEKLTKGDNEEQVLNVLIKCLDSNDKYRIKSVAISLGALGNKKATQPLIEALNKVVANKKVGQQGMFTVVRVEEHGSDIAAALGELKDTSAVTTLIKCLTIQEWSDWLPQKSAEALGKIGDSRAIQPLVSIFHAHKTTYYYSNFTYYANSLVKLGWNPDNKTDSLLLILGAKDIEIINYYRSEIIQKLIRDLNSGNSSIRDGAFDYLIRLGDEGSIDSLLDYLDSYGDASDAQKLLNCGNYSLEIGVKYWAQKQNIKIVETTGIKSGWGAWKKK